MKDYNEVLRQLTERKSVRAYEDKPIEPEKQEAILQAAIQAPTAGNMMLYSILNITDQTLKDRLAVTCDNQPFIAKAPFVLVFAADYQRWFDSFELAKQAVAPEPLRRPQEGDLLLACCDALIAAQNAVVAAQSMGIGSCYIGDILEQYEVHRELFHLPKYAVPVCMLCFGYPTAQQQERVKPSRFALKDVVFENTYQRQAPEQLEAMFRKRAGAADFDFQQSVGAMLKRKWNCEFSKEMSRSVAKMMEEWCRETE